MTNQKEIGAFVLRLAGLPTTVPALAIGTGHLVYPNPACDHAWLEVSPDLLGTPYIVRDDQGRAVAQGRLSDVRTRLNVDGLAAGVYRIETVDKAWGASLVVVAAR